MYPKQRTPTSCLLNPSRWGLDLTFGSKNQPSHLAHHWIASPPHQTYRTPPQWGPLYPKAPSPHVSLTKTKPWHLGFGFGTNQCPSRLTQWHPPTASNAVYPTPTRSPLRKKEPPRISFTKTEPRQFSFQFLAQPSCATQSRTPRPQIQFTPPSPNRSPLSESKSSPLYITSTPTTTTIHRGWM